MDAASTFDAMLSARRPEWEATLPRLREDLRRRGAQYGGRDLVRVLRPKFVTSGEYSALRYACGIIMGAVRRLAIGIRLDPAARAMMGVTEGEGRLIDLSPPTVDPCVLARLDAFQTADGPRFVELNAEAPAGGGFGDAIAAVFSEHPLISDLARRTGARFVPNRDRILETLLVVWRMARGSRKPVILITDFLDARTVNEFHLIAERFRDAGFETLVEDPRKLDYRDGRLYAEGRAIDLVYRRVLVNEFLERQAECRPLERAVADGAVIMVNPFACKLVHKKITFAFLTGDGDPAWMTPEERAVIAAHVPWTRRVRDGRTTVGEKTVDLLEHVAAHRERYVLKPSDDYGGRGVVLGWESTSSDFERALREACNGHWVVQERVATLTESFPTFDPPLAQAELTVDLDPYLYFGHVHGMLARLAAGGINNVTSGGGQTPVMVVPEWPHESFQESLPR